MGVLDRIEKLLEEAVEGFVRRSFGGELHSAEIVRKLVRTVEASAKRRGNEVYVPGTYVVRMGDSDLAEQFSTGTGERVVAALQEWIDAKSYRVPGQLRVDMQRDPALGPERVEVDIPAWAGPDLWVLELTVACGIDRGLQVSVPDEGLLIGRSDRADLVLRDAAVSREHARVVHGLGGWSIFDLDSTNGTFVNDRPVTRRFLQTGDMIRVGETTIALRTVAP